MYCIEIKTGIWTPIFLVYDNDTSEYTRAKNGEIGSEDKQVTLQAIMLAALKVQLLAVFQGSDINNFHAPGLDDFKAQVVLQDGKDFYLAHINADTYDRTELDANSLESEPGGMRIGGRRVEALNSWFEAHVTPRCDIRVAIQSIEDITKSIQELGITTNRTK